jgi:NAD(P)-dependent dehydrogenase (short-subunit alcohol dehydrogenase family)
MLCLKSELKCNMEVYVVPQNLRYAEEQFNTDRGELDQALIAAERDGNRMKKKLEEVAEDNKQLIENLKSKTPIGRIGDPQKIANAIVWLLSDKASFVLGHTLLVDGGIVSR